jgi:hypothetical protein
MHLHDMRIKPVIIVCLYVVMSFSVCSGDERLDFGPIAKKQFPALVYVEELLDHDPADRTRLMIASFDKGKPEIHNIAAAQYISTRRLSDAVFMLVMNHDPKDLTLSTQNYYLVDFQTGSSVLLGESESRDKLVHFYCLHSDSRKNEAIILRYGSGTDESALLHVDLKTLEINVLKTLPITKSTYGFHSSKMKISPDFKRIATMKAIGGYEEVYKKKFFKLRVLDLQTMETIVFEDVITVEVSPVSSWPGIPPFVWLDSEEILYQHMILNEVKQEEFQHDAQYVLKSVNIKNRTTTEWLRNRMRLTLRGGSMSVNRSKKEVNFHDCVVDIPSRSLKPKVSRKPQKSQKIKQLELNVKTLLSPKKYEITQLLVSSSKKNAACFIRFKDDRNETPKIYAQTEEMTQPIIVSDAQFYTSLITWIED